jgi:hypothetical protein
MSREYSSNAGVVPISKRYERRHNRKPVDLAAQFSPVDIKSNVPTNISTIDGLIRNMSAAGLFVKLPMLYRVGTRFQVRIPIDGQLLTFYAIVWRVDLPPEGEKSTAIGHGMKVTTASDFTLDKLTSFINREQSLALV